MTRRPTALWISTALTMLLAAGGWTRSAAAQDEAERAAAREQFDTGVQRYEDEDYQGALEAFQEAYRLAPHPTVRVNMANCYEHLDRPLEALHHFERFLAEAENPSPQQRREVRQAVRRLEGQLGSLRLSVAPDGALVTIDNAETRRAPILEPIRLTEGVHHVSVRMEGYRSDNREIEVEGGEEQRISIRLERGADDEPAVASAGETDDTDEASPAASETEGAEPLAEGGDAAVGGEGDVEPLPADDGGGWELRLTTPVIISGAATGAFLLTAIATGVAAVIYNDEFENAVARANDPGASPAERAQAQADGRSHADSANTMSIVSDVFLITTIAAAGATAFFVIVEGMGGNEDQMAEADDLELRAAPAVGREGGGLVLSGQF